MTDRVGQRTPARVVRALFQGRHYRSALAAARVVKRPVSFLARYALGVGHYPATVEVRTPLGVVPLHVNSWHDLRTIHEIFCADDYRAGPEHAVIVDFGSNIGISAAYFLSRSHKSFIYLFEPLPRNVETLKANMRPFAGRYALEEVAVGLEEGRLTFGWEPTGRYGGLGRQTGNYVTVDVRRARDVLRQVIAERGRIDLLKIDIETLEREITEGLAVDLADHIGTIYVEYLFEGNPLALTHEMATYGTITRFVKRPDAVTA